MTGGGDLRLNFLPSHDELECRCLLVQQPLGCFIGRGSRMGQIDLFAFGPFGKERGGLVDAIST